MDRPRARTAAQLESDGATPPAVAGWRSIAASGEAWIWDERQARAFDLRQRVARRDLTERSDRTNRELLVDPLTGAGNRRGLDAELAAPPRRWCRLRRPRPVQAGQRPAGGVMVVVT